MGPLSRIHANIKLILRWLLTTVLISVAVGSVVALFLWLLNGFKPNSSTSTGLTTLGSAVIRFPKPGPVPHPFRAFPDDTILIVIPGPVFKSEFPLFKVTLPTFQTT